MVVKVFERIVFKYVYNYFKDNFIISIYQSGFLPGMSTVTQLLEVYHSFCKAVDEEKEIRVVFLDISKAFDRVWHKGLIYKLHRCGIRGRLLLWFRDYLRDRMQRVVINGQFSDWGAIEAGVPQGSVLGPLLFLLFINDIVHVVNHCKIRLFADDTCLFIEVDDRIETARLINDDLTSISVWANNWLVSFSSAKTKSMTISNKLDADINPLLTLAGTRIEEVTSHKYLGVNISANLRWKEHINDVALKARKRLNLMTPLKMKLNRESLEIMYKSFVQPVMEYACAVWGGSPDCDISKLEHIHTDGLRFITGATARSNTLNVLQESGDFTISERIQQSSLIMMYNIIHGNAPQYLIDINNELQGEQIHTYNLRDEDNLRIPYCRLSSYKNSFFPRSIKNWNELNREAKTSNSLYCFRRVLKRTNNELNILFYYGERWASVHHARMRMGCSKLHKDLFQNLHVVDSAACSCGARIEDAKHFFFHCPHYANIRQTMIVALQGLMPITVRNMLFGNMNYDIETNQKVFAAVQKFITASERFL